MSTRSQTEFITLQEGQVRCDKRTIYRHSDGYPSAMLPDLLTFIRWNQGRMDDVEYAAANWIFWNKRRMEDALLNPDWELLKRRTNLKWDDKEVEEDVNNVLKLGFGVCNNDEYHGDIEYLYRVVLPNTIGFAWVAGVLGQVLAHELGGQLPLLVRRWQIHACVGSAGYFAFGVRGFHPSLILPHVH